MKTRLLLADDDAGSVDALACFFASSGFDVQIARDGTEALALFRGWAPHAAFLDIDMPGASGYDVARQIRSSGAGTPRILLVAVTGRAASQETSTEMIEAGFDSHVLKPVDLLSLLMLVRQMLGAR